MSCKKLFSILLVPVDNLRRRRWREKEREIERERMEVRWVFNYMKKPFTL